MDGARNGYEDMEGTSAEEVPLMPRSMVSPAAFRPALQKDALYVAVLVVMPWRS